MNRIQKQQGLGIVGWIIVLGIIAFFTIVTTKTMPMYLFHMKVVKAVRQVAGTGSYADSEPGEIHRALERHWDVEGIAYKTFHYRQIKVKQLPGGQRALSYDYELRSNLFYNIFIVIHFKDDVPLRRMSH